MKVFICEHCGAEIKRKRVRNPPQFCSALCRSAAYLDELEAGECADMIEDQERREAKDG